MYRVFDTKRHKWVKENVYLTPDDKLLKIKQSAFGWLKVPLELSEDRYIYHNDINLYDKNNILVYEGDIVRANTSENIEKIGLVCYAPELSSYIILCEDSNEFFTLGNEVCEFIEVIGNVFDGYKGKDYGEPAL